MENNTIGILHLVLTRKWFDMIKSGEKKEEYREITPFWSRVFSHNIKIKGKHYHPTDVHICFSLGYSKCRKQVVVSCLGLKTASGKTEWGAKENEQYYILSLGEILYTN